MFTTSQFARTNDYLQMSMGASARRQETISNNIANVDTPFYKTKQVTFESEFNRVLDLNNKIKFDRTPFKTSNKRHIALETSVPYQSVSPKIIEEYDTNYRNDKNNVDIEKETSILVKNTLQYNALTTAITSHFMRFKSVLV